MGIISKANSFTGTTAPQLTWLDTDLDTIYAEFNGSIEDANIKATAAIAQSKIANLATDMAARVLDVGDTMTGQLKIKYATPALRLTGTEGSAKDWQIVESAGSVLLQENTGTEGTPAWITRVTFDSSGLATGAGARENLVVTRTSADVVNVTADSLTLLDANGGQYIARAVNVSPDLSAADANGLDTGGEASSTWYFLYVIKGVAGVAGLFSLSATAPTLPTGYTYALLVGAVRNDASSNILAFKQVGNTVQFDVPIKVATGVGSTTTASLSLATAIPSSRVKSVWGRFYNSASGSRDVYFDSITFSNTKSPNSSGVAFAINIPATSAAIWLLPEIRETQLMYIQVSSTNNLDAWVSAFSLDW